LTKPLVALSKRTLRRRVGEEVTRIALRTNVGDRDGHLSKDDIRSLHSAQRLQLFVREQRFVTEWQEELLESFANGKEVKPDEISPRVVQVRTEEQAALFRYASLHWSIPVSRGYGRRTRFLVMDEQNDKLIGIFALGDPVYNLTARDEVIGWNVEQRSDRLYSVLDAFVLGAIPPYRQLLGGKLVAMAAVSDTTREMIRRKYEGKNTNIRGEVKPSRPVLITTTSALGRSSLYNRLRYQDRLLYQSVGYTKGFGHFHFSEELFQNLLKFLSNDGGVPGYAYGSGPNWRIRALRVALTKLDLDPNLLRHGVKREVFLAPLARRWKEYLRGEATYPCWYEQRLGDLAAHFRQRWATPRAQRDSSYRQVKRGSMRLLPLHNRQS
jgi:hypothetical protein